MTIPPYLHEANEQLTAAEDCADHAPAGTYAQTKAIVETVHDLSNKLLADLRNNSLKIHNDDRLRSIEAHVYGYIRLANPDSELPAGEGFGRACQDPYLRKKLTADAIRSRDVMAAYAQLPPDALPTPDPFRDINPDRAQLDALGKQATPAAQPDPDGWIKHRTTPGDARLGTLPPDARVDIMMRGRVVRENLRASDVDWSVAGYVGDVTHYRLHKPGPAQQAAPVRQTLKDIVRARAGRNGVEGLTPSQMLHLISDALDELLK